MAEFAHGGFRVGVVGFAQIFEDEATPAKFADELLPTMEVFDGVGLAVQAIDTGREWIAPVIGFLDKVAASGRKSISLEAGRLFVHADIDATWLCHPGNFAVDLC